MKTEIKEKISDIVNCINLKQESLKSFSNDELRYVFNSIGLSLNDSKSENNLDKYIVDIFALVKETARRLTCGDVCFTANENDNKLAQNKSFDFITVKDAKAIYHNHWLVKGYDMQWNMVHYDEQIMGGILLHKGYAVEMATGEGKTLVATLPVFLNAMTHRGVHVMTVNDYLSERDYEITRPLYLMYGLTVDCIENYPSHDYRSGAYACDIVFGTNSSFTFDYLYDHLAMRKEDCVQRKHYYAIIDELDSILIDDADQPHVIGGGNFYNEGDLYKKYNKIIKSLLAQENSDSYYKADLKNKKVSFTEKGLEWIQNVCNDSSLFQFEKAYQIPNYLHLPREEKERFDHNFIIQNALNRLLEAYILYTKDIDYIVDNLKRIIIVDSNTGRLKPKSRWEYGLHSAIEAKENVPIKSDFESIAIISLKNYFKLYDKVAGMSGTLIQVKDELKSVYNLKTAIVPPHRRLIRKDYPLKVFRTKGSKDNAIIKTIKEIHSAGRPILVGCPTIVRSEEIAKELKDSGIPFELLNAKELFKEAYLISHAGEESKITVATSIAGRGTDIKLTEKAKMSGGLAVIGTDILESERVDKQLRGRAGRQGDPGSSMFFSSLQDEILNYLTPEQKKSLKDITDNIPNDELTSDEVRNYFLLALQNKEYNDRKSRERIALKDDTIAPYRTKFYNQRNSILFSANAVNDILGNINVIVSNKVAIEKRISDLYVQLKPILIRERGNNKIGNNTTIPFSSCLKLYVITLDVDKTLKSEEYFNYEFKKQIILQAYDDFWMKFVRHLNENLDEKEIKKLPKDFIKVMSDIDDFIFGRILKSSIPIGSKPLLDRPTVPEQPKDLQKKKISISPDDPCPCGSGKKYGECHGRGIHHKKPSGRR